MALESPSRGDTGNKTGAILGHKEEEVGWGQFRGLPPPAELFIPEAAAAAKPGLVLGLSCQSFLKQLCSKAYAGLTSEGNFLFGEVEAKEFPVWADRAS